MPPGIVSDEERFQQLLARQRNVSVTESGEAIESLLGDRWLAGRLDSSFLVEKVVYEGYQKAAVQSRAG